MKILHINDYYIYSWAEKVYRDIYENLKGEKITLEDYIYQNEILRLFNKFFFSFILFVKIKRKIKLYNPDIILIHQINLSPFSVLLAIKKHKNIVQIVHDATQAWCPSWWCIYRKNYEKCDIKMWLSKCTKNCAYDKTKVWFFFYYFWLKLFLYLKKKVVKKYISPSAELQKILLNNHYYNTTVLWNIIKLNKISDTYKKENIFLYVWAIDRRKWIDKLIEAIDELDFLKKDWQFLIIWSWEILESLKNKYNNNFYQFLWKIPNSEVIEYYKKSKVVFFPSIWFESFWLTALEGILYNNIVLWNNFWWVKEIIWDDFLFDILNKKSVNEKIINVLNNFDEYYLKTQEKKKKLIINNKLYFLILLKILNK